MRSCADATTHNRVQSNNRRMWINPYANERTMKRGAAAGLTWGRQWW